MNIKIHKYISILALFLAIIITSLVLFKAPMPGVADQGDFQRVMNVTGLSEVEEGIKDKEQLWYKYVVPYYKMEPAKLYRFIGIVPTTSMIYPISAAKTALKIIGKNYFDTKALAVVYSVLYIIGLYVCFKNIKFKRNASNILFILLALFILMDGNYLIWFNSLYGEPMIMIGLILFCASVLHASNSLEENNYRKFIFIFLSALLFLGSKLQCFVSLPLIMFLIIRIVRYGNENIDMNKIIKKLVLPILILIFYVGGIYVETSSSTGVDTEFNSVFYGVLKNSKSPKEDLAALALPQDMALETGKHAYLPKEDYVKYVPWSELTKTEFNEKISNFKLLKFYLLRPKRLIEGMEYTASKAFDTGTSLGKFEMGEADEYTGKFNRFTLWSRFRSEKLPKSFLFLVLFYAVLFTASVMEYIKRKEDKSTRLKIELFWTVMLIGLLQFPMPYIGNGEADTAKQLFLFNYTFDIMFLVSCTWIFDKIYKRLTGAS